MAWHKHLIAQWREDMYRIRIKMIGAYNEDDGHKMVELAFKILRDPTRPSRMTMAGEKTIYRRRDGLYESAKSYQVDRHYSNPWEMTVRCIRKRYKM